MGRGTELAEGISINEGRSPGSGVYSIIHFQGDQVIFERQQDMEPVLQHVQEMRERNALRGFGVAKELGHVPDLFYAKFRVMPSEERRKAIRAFLIENPKLCAVPPGYFKLSGL